MADLGSWALKKHGRLSELNRERGEEKADIKVMVDDKLEMNGGLRYPTRGTPHAGGSAGLL